jgi:benzoylformate decarboxylase
MRFLSAAMGGLGFAMPAAVGLRMGCDRPVIAIVGDGSSQYSIQSIWSAVEYQVGVLFIIMNNGSYSIMDRLAEMQSYSRKVWPPLGHIDISKLAQGYGRDSLRIENQSQLDDAFTSLIPKLSSLSSPVLLDVQVESDPTFEP